MKYKIIISYNHESSLIFTEHAPYFNSLGKTDVVCFSNKGITIEAERKRKFTEDEIFMNVQNSLYNQMLKCLQIHFCYEGNKAGISEINIVEKGKYRDIPLFKRIFANTKQPFPIFSAPIPFDGTSLKMLLKEDDSSFVLRIIVLHWLSQGHYEDRLRRLECIWRTFEHLCNYILHDTPGKRSNIAKGLDRIVQELVANSRKYSQTCAIVNSETQESLRELRWREMIENNYPKTTGNSNYSNNYQNYLNRLITPYVDERVISLMKDVLVYRKGELNRYGFYTIAIADLNAKISMHTQKDIDVVAILCYYTYYLRNRLFHGQSLVRGSIFDAHRADNMRIDFISQMLSVLTVELINNYASL